MADVEITHGAFGLQLVVYWLKKRRERERVQGFNLRVFNNWLKKRGNERESMCVKYGWRENIRERCVCVCVERGAGEAREREINGERGREKWGSGVTVAALFYAECCSCIFLIFT